MLFNDIRYKGPFLMGEVGLETCTLITIVEHIALRIVLNMNKW